MPLKISKTKSKCGAKVEKANGNASLNGYAEKKKKKKIGQGWRRKLD